MSATLDNTTAPTQFVDVGAQRYAYRRFGGGADGRPLLFLQHFTGTLDNWDPAVTDPLAEGREVILFESAGIGRSSGEVPTTVAGMATHALAFLDALHISSCDVLGFSLGGMVALEMVKQRPAVIGKLVLVGTAPRGGEDVMHLDKPSLTRHLQNPQLKGYDLLQKLFFTESPASQEAGAAFIARLMRRLEDREPLAGPGVAGAQMAAFRDWEKSPGERFVELRGIRQPTMIVQGVHDEMIAVRNSYRMAENLPNATLLTYPDAGHGSLFQYHESFVRHVDEFLVSRSAAAVF